MDEENSKYKIIAEEYDKIIKDQKIQLEALSERIQELKEECKDREQLQIQVFDQENLIKKL